MKKMLVLFMSILSGYSFSKNKDFTNNENKGFTNKAIYEHEGPSKNRKNPFKIINNISLKTKEFSSNKNEINAKEIPIKNLSFIGFIKKQSIVWALVKYPNGRIERVQYGDYLGHRRKVVRIEEGFIVLEEKSEPYRGKTVRTSIISLKK